MSPELITLIREQLKLAEENFVRDVCQIADGQVEELFGDPDGIVAISYLVEGDDGRTRMLYLKIDIGFEDHELINEKDFVILCNELDDWADFVPEL